MKPELSGLDGELSRIAKNPKGALLPPGMEWQEGRSAASIAFVSQAERAISLLQQKLEEVKAKKFELMDWLEVRTFLQQQGID